MARSQAVNGSGKPAGAVFPREGRKEGRILMLRAMRKGRIHALAVIGVTIVAAALVALNTTGPSTVGSAPAAAAPHAMHVSATAAHAHAQGVLYSIHRGLVKDCVEIQIYDGIEYTGYNMQIRDEGAYNRTIMWQAPGSCWNLINEFGVDYNGTDYTGYEYQDLRGDCLWDDNGAIETSAVCTDLANYESFFGVHYYPGEGWTVADTYWGPSRIMATPTPIVDYAVVNMDNSSTIDDGCAPFCPSHFWNFP
jgi:hypothetical protein